MADHKNEEATAAAPTPPPPHDLESNTKPKEAAPSSEDKKMTSSPQKLKKRPFAPLLSIATLILSLPVLASIIWLLYMKNYDCEKLLKLPKLQTGIALSLILVFLVSNVVVLLRSRVPAPGFFIVMVPLMMMLTMGLALVGSYNMQSRQIMATPRWFKEKVRDGQHWANIKSCIYSSHACDDLAARSFNLKDFDFSLKKLSYIEYGCCKPPAVCGMVYVNATFWERSGDDSSANKGAQRDRDCDIWKNDENSLCYDCDACRDGFVRIMESKWLKLGILLIVMSLLLITSHVLLFVAVMWELYTG